MASNSMNEKVNVSYLTRRKNAKKSNIEIVEELKYLGVIVQAKGNVFEGHKNEMMKKNQKIERDDKLRHRKKVAID